MDRSRRFSIWRHLSWSKGRARRRVHATRLGVGRIRRRARLIHRRRRHRCRVRQVQRKVQSHRQELPGKLRARLENAGRQSGPVHSVRRHAPSPPSPSSRLATKRHKKHKGLLKGRRPINNHFVLLCLFVAKSSSWGHGGILESSDHPTLLLFRHHQRQHRILRELFRRTSSASLNMHDCHISSQEPDLFHRQR